MGGSEVGGFELWLVRHGATEWSLNGRHTGSRTDLPLLPQGEEGAQALRSVLGRHTFAAAYTSPLQRARRTAELAGFPDAQRTDLLLEYDYGDYEGLTSAQIRSRRPDWELFRDGCPGGETPGEALARATRFTELAHANGGRVIAFAHGHILRLAAAAWLDLSAAAAARLDLDTATVSILAGAPGSGSLRLWNGIPPQA